MKISCQSCHSKYNVADEKVQGKIVKIRCRKCGATIVVNGTGGAATNGTADAGGAQTDTTQWHVNVGENDQRTLTIGELIDAYNGGVVTQDTFIWADGMDDWKPLAEVEAVVSALHASSSQITLGASATTETHPVTQEAHDSGTAQGAMPAFDPSPPASDPVATWSAQAAEPKRAAVAKARGRDLFATNAGEELQTSAPATAAVAAPPAGDASLTGQRNENSVLFSLAVLTHDAETRGPATSGPVNKDDSGLIDLKALAAKAESMRPPPGMGGDVFHSPLGMVSPLGAPVGAMASMAPEQAKSKLPLYIGAGAGLLVLMVLCIVIGVKLAGPGPAPMPTMIATTVAPPAMTTSEPAATTTVAGADSSASAAPSASVATGAKKVPGVGGGAWHPPGPATTKPGGPPVVGGSGGGTAPTGAPPPKRGGDCGCNGDLMCLMKCSTH